MRSRLATLVAASAVLVGGGIAYFTRSAPALADYSPPALVDAQTFPLRAVHSRLRGGTFSCHSICRSARTAGVKPEFCSLSHAIDAGTYAAAGVECVLESISDCTAQAVGECQNPVQP